MKSLPNYVRSYARTPQFTETTVPKKLLANHDTKPGTWGVIAVEKGQLRYVIADSEEVIVTNRNPGIIEPTIPHYICPMGAVSFHVEFYK